MELTRRDALAVLAAMGSGAGGSAALLAEDRLERKPPADSGGGRSAGIDEHSQETLVSIAVVVYPSEVTGIETFVRTYLAGRIEDRPERADAITDTVERLDEVASDWFEAPTAALDSETRERLLDEVGADTAEPDPGGSLAERVRFYLVNELLYALYTSPTGGKLVGIENPQGHPGGLDSYRRGPAE